MLATAPVAHAQKRVALTVGINQYDNLRPDAQLRKARSDAMAVAVALRDMGFEVIAKDDVTRSAFNGHWQDFLNKLAPGDMAAFFFAGHGVELGGRNYLLPRDVPNVRPGREELLKRESLSLQEFLADLREKGTRLNLVILDACRDNPFEQVAGRSIGRTRGLAVTEPPEGTFIMFSAGSGESALDRLDDGDRNANSIYTRLLLPLLKSPGLSLTDVAEQVRADVRRTAATVQHRQTPAYYNQVLGRMCLAGGDCGPRVASVPSAATATSNEAAAAWDRTKDTSSTVALEAFVRRFGDTYYSDLAKARLAELKQIEAARQEADAAKRKADEEARAKARLAELKQNEAAKQVADSAKKRADEEARAKAEIERRRIALALLQKEEERKAAATTPSVAPRSEAERAPSTPSSFKLMEPAKWMLQAAFPASLPVYYDSAVALADAIKNLSDGTLQIETAPAGQIVPAFEILEATHRRVLDAAWGTPTYWMGKHKATVFFSGTLPFGLSASALVRWMEAEGTELMNDIYSRALKLNVRSFPCGIVGPTAEWFKRPIADGPALLKRKVRLTGLSGDIAKRAGGNAVAMPGGDIVPAAARGALDGTSWTTPQHGVLLGLPKVMKVLYYPGWSAPATLLELIVNRDKWSALDRAAQEGVAAACRRNLHLYLDKIAAIEERGLSEARAAGVQVLTYPTGSLDALKAAAATELKEAARRDPEFAKVMASYDKFR